MRSLQDLEAELADVLAQIVEAKKQLKERRQRRVSAIAEIRRLMRQHRLTLDDLHAPARLFSAKYRDEKTGNAWSGNGALPSWIKAALNDGKKLEDFSVST